jgi:hypothetical protein
VSFFDEADEPPRTEIRSSTRPTGRRRNSGGSGRGGRRRPPSGPTHQSIVARRAVAVAALVIVIVLIAVGVNSCQSSARKSALQDYANNVNSVINRSHATSDALFKALSGGSGSGATAISRAIDATETRADAVLQSARGLSVPSAAQTANGHLLLALRMRVDGITNIANEIQPALGTSVNQQAVDQIATQMARFYASDVLYKDYMAPELVSALHANDISVGGQDGTQINPDQFLQSINWLTPLYVAGKLGVTLSSSGSKGSGKPVTGLHGDELNSVTLNGTTLSPGASATVAASPPPTFDLNFSDSGNFDETDVTCKVTVTGTSASGTQVIPVIDKGKSATCAVKLPSSPPKGTYTVQATIEKVLGETRMSNNTAAFTVTFN